MIQVNLLPPEKRPPEGTSPARLTVIILGVLFPVLGLLLDFRYWSKTQEAVKQTEIQEAANKTKRDEIDAQKAITKEIKQINDKTQAIKDLREHRMLWGRLHYRFYQMMTALDQVKNEEGNVVVRRYSMKKESGDRYTIELGVEVLGTELKDMSMLQATFMRTVNRYSGAEFIRDSRVLSLAIALQGINPVVTLKPEETAGLPPKQIQHKQHDAFMAAAKAAADKLKTETIKKWTADEAPGFVNNKAGMDEKVAGMVADAEELVRINSFTGVIFDQVLFKRLEKTGATIPAPPPDMIISNPESAALKVDFQLSFQPGSLASLTAKKAPANR